MTWTTSSMVMDVSAMLVERMILVTAAGVGSKAARWSPRGSCEWSGMIR
jgi:hypothetical protein